MQYLIGQTIGNWHFQSLLTGNDRFVFFQARNIETGEIGRVCTGGRLKPHCFERRIAPYLAFEGDEISTVKSYERADHHTVIQLPIYDVHKTVEDKFKEQSPFSLAESLGILANVACALDAGHAAGLVHGSVRPYSILLDGTLMDWGLEYCIIECLEPMVEARVSNSWLAYSSIEEIRGFEIVPAMERFSLAAIAFKMLTAQTIYESADILGFIMEYVRGDKDVPVIPISQENPALPSLLDVVFERALARNPDERFETAMAFVEAMASCI